MTRLMTLAAAGLIAAAPALAQPRELSLATNFPPTHTMQQRVFEPLAQRIAAATGGAVRIRIYPAGELGAGAERTFQRVVDGVADMGFSLPGYTGNLFPRTMLIELPGAVPGDATNVDRIWNAMELLAPDYRRVELLGLWTNMPPVILSARRPVRTAEDLRGMTIRAPSPQQAAVLRAWGANPVTMPATEIYTAMQTGVIDAAMIGPDGLRTFRLNEVTRFLTRDVPGGVATLFLVGNRDAFRAIPAEHRALVMAEFGRPLSRRGLQAYLDADAEAFALAERSNIEIIRLPEPDQARLREAAEPVISQSIATLRGQGIDGAAILAALRRAP
jgi:TRAP-type C4-dicarboxylate transport system substrate-binding protein